MAHKEATIYYYDDPLKSDFGPQPTNLKKIRGNYKYARNNFFVRLLDFISYRLIMTPIAWFYIKVIRRFKVINKKALKASKGKGIIIYANHTHPIGDAFGPPVYAFPRKVSVITNAANVSLPVFGGITKQWGAMPLPEDYESSKNFVKEMKRRLSEKDVVIIYPEATLWPYYTGIRPFTSQSFSYPLSMNVPVYSFTTVYVKKKNGKLASRLYIDGPHAISEGSTSEQKEALRNSVYETMLERSRESTYVKYRYEQRKSS